MIRNYLVVLLRNMLRHRVFTLINKEYAVLILLANAIAWPIAFTAMDFWLREFAFRISMPVEAFLISAFAGALLALTTVAYHGIRQSLANPVDALRRE